MFCIMPYRPEIERNLSFLYRTEHEGGNWVEKGSRCWRNEGVCAGKVNSRFTWMVDQRMTLIGNQSVARVNWADVSGKFAYGSVQVALPLDGDGENLIKPGSTEWTGSLKLLPIDNPIHNRSPSAFTQVLFCLHFQKSLQFVVKTWIDY